MAGIESNYAAAVRPFLAALPHLLDPDRAAHGRRRLGDEMADVVAAGVIRRTVDRQLDEDGKPFKKLSRRYLLSKLRNGYPATISVRTGDMMDFEQVRGRVAIGPREVVMSYGIDGEEQQKAEYFSEARPFYALDDATIADVDDLCDEAIDAGIREL